MVQEAGEERHLAGDDAWGEQRTEPGSSSSLAYLASFLTMMYKQLKMIEIIEEKNNIENTWLHHWSHLPQS